MSVNNDKETKQKQKVTPKDVLLKTTKYTEVITKTEK